MSQICVCVCLCVCVWRTSNMVIDPDPAWVFSCLGPWFLHDLKPRRCFSMVIRVTFENPSAAAACVEFFLALAVACLSSAAGPLLCGHVLGAVTWFIHQRVKTHNHMGATFCVHYCTSPASPAPAFVHFFASMGSDTEKCKVLRCLIVLHFQSSWSNFHHTHLKFKSPPHSTLSPRF